MDSQNQQTNQSTTQTQFSQNQQLPEQINQSINPLANKPKLPINLIISGTILIVAIAIGAFWAGRHASYNIAINQPQISIYPVITDGQQNNKYCNSDTDCINKCLGCYRKGFEPKLDCGAMPVGTCNCVNNVCVRFQSNSIWQTINYSNFSFNLPVDFYLERNDTYYQSQKSTEKIMSVLVFPDFQSWTKNEEISKKGDFSSEYFSIKYSTGIQKANNYQFIKTTVNYKDDKLRNSINYTIRKPNTDDCITISFFKENIESDNDKLPDQIIETFIFK